MASESRSQLLRSPSPSIYGDLAKTSESIFRRLQSGKISRNEFVHLYDGLYPRIPKGPVKRNLDKRMDKRGRGTTSGRSLGRFALAIYDSTRREKFLVEEWARLRGVTVTGYGADNSGMLILDPKKTSRRPDYIVWHDGKSYKLEVKFCPCLWKLTFKVADLMSYIRDDAFILVISGHDTMIGGNGDPAADDRLYVPKGMVYSVIGPCVMQKMLDELPHRNYREVGGKVGVQLRGSRIEEYFFVEPWPV